CDVAPEGARDAAQVDAVVAPEAAVLDRDVPVLDQRRDLVDLDDDAPLGGKVRDRRAVGRVDAARLRWPVVAQGVDRWAVERGRAGDRRDHDDGHRDRQHAGKWSYFHGRLLPPGPSIL